MKWVNRLFFSIPKIPTCHCEAVGKRVKLLEGALSQPKQSHTLLSMRLLHWLAADVEADVADGLLVGEVG